MGAKKPAVAEYMDMAPIAPVSGDGAITDGFSVDDKLQLHWRSSKFKDLPQVGKVIMEQQGGEAGFGFFKSAAMTQGKVLLYAELGCHAGEKGKTSTMATHGGMHDPLIEGKVVVVAL